ncbi:adenylate/guanylate cyclase domain-containing protein [Pontimicrobium sp. MEBiC01747]
MKNNVLQFLRLLLWAIVFWILALCLFITIRYYAIGELETGIENDISIIQWLFNFGIISGVIVGTFYAIVDFLFDKYVSKKLSIGLVFIQKSIIYLFSLIISITFISRKVEEFGDVNLPNDVSGWWIKSKVFWLIIVYFIICSLVFAFIKIANQKFGKGIFIKLLIGHYKKPREEKRIFMFLDLQASTTIAEQLGHYKYSEFIQECFYDLNIVITKYNADIYQYVGDEAVLSWPYTKGIVKNNCIELFYSFEARLLKKEKQYMQKYGVYPKFKAGVHGGDLIVTEVGTVKKEIAYHGDVINTTARIQGECNKYKQRLLISESLLRDLKLKNNYSTTEIGNIALKGKEEKVTLFTINKV